jgi:ribose 5-phosphate isomerase B
MMNIAIGADHRGFTLKRKITSYLTHLGYKVKDCGTDSEDPVDYPDIALYVSRSVTSKKARFGILICFTGQGMTMTANKVKGIRAALCTTPKIARLTREHNDANVLVLPGYLAYGSRVRETVKTFLLTRFAGGRHKRRVDKIKRLEKHRMTT